MTQMQVDFQKLQETRRHNAELERQGLMEQETKSRQADASMKSAEASDKAATARMIQSITGGVKDAIGSVSALFLL